MFAGKFGIQQKNQRVVSSASPPWVQSAQAGHDGASAVVAAEAVKGV